MQSLTLQDLQGHIDRRRKKGVAPVTLKKEMATVRACWNWAVHGGGLKGAFPGKGLRFPKEEEKESFCTFAEIEAIIAAENSDDDRRTPSSRCPRPWPSFKCSSTQPTQRRMTFLPRTGGIGKVAGHEAALWCISGPITSRIVPGEPVQQPAQHVLAMSGLANAVSLVGVDHHLRRHLASAQGLIKGSTHR